MEIKRAKRILFGLGFVAMVSFVSTGCGSKDDPKPAAGKINLKITVTVLGADNQDQVDISVTAANHDASQYGAPVWKINGVTQDNESHILYDEQRFLGATKTYVFETVKPYDFGYLNVSYSTDANSGPVTLSYKTEVSGAVETNVENLVIPPGSGVVAKKFSYTGK